jgi:alpha-glucuronidase
MAFYPKSYAELFEQTLTYLRQSDLAAFIIDQLEESPAPINVEIGGHVQKNGYRPGEDLGGTIRWNPYKRVHTKEEEGHRKSAGSYQKKLAAVPAHLQDEDSMAGALSPAMLLMHEMGHAYQRLSNDAEFRTMVQRGKKGVKEIENLNVNAIENTVAQELRDKGILEGVRWRYQDIKGVGWFKDKAKAYEVVEEPFPGWFQLQKK